MMKSRSSLFITTVIGCGAAIQVVNAADPQLTELDATAQQTIQSFAKTLQGTLKSALQEGGPVHAIATCQSQAPAITSAAGADNWHLKRTSLKVRNPANRPDEWELKVLQQFEALKQQGQPLPALKHSEIIEKEGRRQYRYMSAIPTGPVCLTCHGNTIDTTVQAALNDKYPQDQATGFAVGDLRGAFSVSYDLP